MAKAKTKPTTKYRTVRISTAAYERVTLLSQSTGLSRSKVLEALSLALPLNVIEGLTMRPGFGTKPLSGRALKTFMSPPSEDEKDDQLL